VLEWVFRRCDDAIDAVDTPIGRVPTKRGLDTAGLEIDSIDLEAMLAVDPAEWLEEIGPIREFYAEFGAKLPRELEAQLDALEQRLRDAG
jgi:phosphoenolpyruvate carboxykinase (GTP)